MRASAAQFAARAARLAAILVGLAGLAAGAAWGGARAKQWLHTSPTFAIDLLEFEGDERAQREELIRLSGLALGDNIFQADVAGAEKAMALHPWVQAVAIDRSYPRTLRIRVIEHVPAALADLGGLYYVDEQGRAFKRLGPGEDGDLPILTGAGRDEYVADAQEVERLFSEALEALAQYRDRGLEERAPVSEIRVDATAGLTLFCGREAVAVRLGRDHYAEKFERLDRLLTELSRRRIQPEVIRLDNSTRPGWVAVQTAQGAGEKSLSQ